MIGFVAAAALATGSPTHNGCAGHWRVMLKRESFADNGAGRRFSEAKLALLNARLTITIMAALRDACADGKVSTAAARRVREVRVLSASGATEPHFYEARKGTLHLEWVFAEENLAVPSREEIIAAAACWSNPRQRSCADRGD